MFANLDILRALAVSLVVADHGGKFFGLPARWCDPAGQIGVLLFFVHTSLVLMFSLERTRSESRGMFWRFYGRRAFRIYPLAIAAILVSVGFGLPSGHLIRAGIYDIPDVTPAKLLSNLLLVQNLSDHRPILVQMWSLPLEIQMYLLLPAIFLVARRWGVTSILGLWCASVVLALAQQMTHIADVRLSIVQYVPHFVSGVIAYSLWARPTFAIRGRWWIPAVTTCCAVAYALETTWHAWLMTLAVGSLTPQFAQVSNRVVNTLAHYTAKYSYGIYLAHNLVFWAAFRIDAPLAVQVVACIILQVAVPATLFHLIEAPMIRLGARLSVPGAPPAMASTTLSKGTLSV